MTYFMDVDWQQAVMEARDERDAATAMAEREGRRADDLAARHYEATQQLEQKDLEIATLKKQLRDETLLRAQSREEAATTLATTLRHCNEMVATTNAAKESAENALNHMT